MNWDSLIDGHREVVDYIREQMAEAVDAVSEELIQALAAGNKILICGNGGSACDAQHMAGELVNRFLIAESRPYAAIALTADAAVMTSIGNDFGFDQAYQKQVEALGRTGDVLIGISTSGNSPNVVKAVEVGKLRGLTTIGFLGGDGGQMAAMVDHALTIGCTKTVPRIQEGHLVILHAICEAVEEALESRRLDYE